MSIEEKFFTLAIRESNFPDQNNDPSSYACIAVMGAIGQCPGAVTREGTVTSALVYLRDFSKNAERAIEDEMEDDEPNLEMIAEIRKLMDEADCIDLKKFAALIGADWDDRCDPIYPMDTGVSQTSAIR